MSKYYIYRISMWTVNCLWISKGRRRCAHAVRTTWNNQWKEWGNEKITSDFEMCSRSLSYHQDYGRNQRTPLYSDQIGFMTYLTERVRNWAKRDGWMGLGRRRNVFFCWAYADVSDYGTNFAVGWWILTIYMIYRDIIAQRYSNFD